MKSASLSVSFWHVGLENIPEGSFVHRCVTPEQAKRLIGWSRSRRPPGREDTQSIVRKGAYSRRSGPRSSRRYPARRRRGPAGMHEPHGLWLGATGAFAGS